MAALRNDPIDTSLPQSDARIESAFLPPELAPDALWLRCAQQLARFCAQRCIPVRDVIVLVPFVQQLPAARRGWSAHSGAGWMPRFETSRTLARSLSVPRRAADGAISFDPVIDLLQAQRLLGEAVPRWSDEDPRGFDLAAKRMVELAHSLATMLLSLSPALRAVRLVENRERLSAVTEPGAQERALARLALEWAAGVDSSATDSLFALRPAAWVFVSAGGVDPLSEELARTGTQPVLWLDADAPLHAPFTAARASQLALAVCTDFEDEAQRAAAEVMHRICAGEQPVALIAQDRVLVRRVRALLERQHVQVSDETGWKLSTTRAGTLVAALLRAARAQAGTDEVLDLLKSCTQGERDTAALDALEHALRRAGVARASHAESMSFDEPALQAWARYRAARDALRMSARARLGEWLARLHAALVALGAFDALSRDAAGAQVLAALRLDAQGGNAWPASVRDAPLTPSRWQAWIDDVFEQVAFRPQADEQAQVIVTPLARAVLRPFASVVFPGADAQHLGAPVQTQRLLGETLATALGLPEAQQRRDAQTLEFAHMLRVPNLALLRRRNDIEDVLAPSPLIERLALALHAPIPQLPERRVQRAVQAEPVDVPAAQAVALRPARLNATACEWLRACPYRFHALHLLGLSQQEELEDALDKRDYGTWLHAVLQQFHVEPPGPDEAADTARLLDIAARQQAHDRLDDADFLPFLAWFQRLAPAYVAWARTQHAHGASVLHTELALVGDVPGLREQGVSLKGTLDRIDAVSGEGARAWRIVDYKTSSREKLRKRVADPLEDTQLAFYAALLESAHELPAGGLQAGYLALDGREIAWVEHADVRDSAQALLRGLAEDLSRMAQGEPLRPLGEGAVCEFCEARGLCRKDHWGAHAQPADKESAP